jgi:HNH endonuclease
MSVLNAQVRKQVSLRANHLCEYCGALATYSAQPFVIEHIIPKSKEGTDDIENLAYACGGCNGSKYTKTQGIDPFNNESTPLYNPRTMVWQEHFIWSSDFLEIIGISNIGRATVATLKMNHFGIKNLRKLWLMDNLHPPF